MAIAQSGPTLDVRARLPKPGAEVLATLGGTLLAATLLVLAAMNVGPLWRDEVNSANVAQMPSLHALWHNLSFESFPLLWLLLLRGWAFLGLADSDAGIRVLGLYVGLFFLVSLWLCARWTRCRAPILSIALLGFLPAFIFIIDSNRAYGLASCLLVLCFGMIWRVVEFPSRARVLWAGLSCILFVQCVYYDVIFLAAMLAGAGLVALRLRRWKTLGILIGIGAVSVGSLAIYHAMFHRGTPTTGLIEAPSFGFSTLWNQLGDTVTLRSSGEYGHNGPEIWYWIALVSGGLVVALILQRTYHSQLPPAAATAVPILPAPADLALFCAVTLVLGVLGLFAFLLHLRYLTQSWYYIEMLCLCAVSLDGLLGANWPALRPWGWLRLGFLVFMMGWGAKPAWAEAHTRRSNVDLIAKILDKNAADGDLILVSAAWEGITFNRYYHGLAHWMTVPPIDSHLVHRNDLVVEKINQERNHQYPMAPVLQAVTTALQSSNAVWVVGNLPVGRPGSPPAGKMAGWFGAYIIYWGQQVSTALTDHAIQEQVLNLHAGPVCFLENLPVIRFTGYKPAPDRPADGR